MQRNIFRIGFLFSIVLPSATLGIEIVVDYSFDTRGFFDAPVRRAAIEAVADRFSRVITTELKAVQPILDLGPPTPWRIGFSHPGTGENHQLSTASSQEDDPIVTAGGPPANSYGFDGLEFNQWILYVGGRSLTSSGAGGTGTGINFNTVFDYLDGPLHRGVFSNSPNNTAGDLPSWGGAASFDEDTDWHFDLDSEAPAGYIDFYSLALHEVAHSLGISTSWNQWQQHVDGQSYLGQNAIDALNADNNSSYNSIALTADTHWEDGVYQSKVFQPGSPNEVGTVGNGLQDLLLEPTLNFVAGQRRMELTNVDVGALVDIGWSILAANDLDLNKDERLNGLDVDLACSEGIDLQPYYDELNFLRGDINLDGAVNFLDFLTLSTNFQTDEALYSTGDLTCDTYVDFQDFLVLSTEFGATVGVVAVPEPSYYCAAVLGIILASCRRRFTPSAV